MTEENSSAVASSILEKKPAKSENASQILAPFRALGLICSPIPFAIEPLGDETYVTVAIGKTFQIFDCSKLSVKFVGAQHSRHIKAIACRRETVFTAAGPHVNGWRKGKKLVTSYSHNAKVYLLLVFGDFLLSVSEDRVLMIWHILSSTLYNTIQFPEDFKVTTMIHPDTYLNKILFGSESGKMQLWNIKTMKMIYEFKGWGSAITCIEQSPAVDVVGIGMTNGKIAIHNLKLDRTLLVFTQAEGSVTSLSFRTDTFPILASGNSFGTIALWDLEKRKLQAKITDVHQGAVYSMKFLQSEPLLVTSGADNSLKIWIFDQADGTARLLRSRSGHSAPITQLKFYPEGVEVVSGSLDRSLRRFHIVADQTNAELSQGNVASRAKKLQTSAEALKLRPIVALDISRVKERDWDNIVTCHENDNRARTWNYQSKVIGKHTLQALDPSKHSINAVAISTCGNFAIIGTNQGWIDKFNLQSGIHRGSCKDPSKKGYAHSAAVQGLVTDGLNNKLISGSLDKTIKIWNFTTLELMKVIELDSPLSLFTFHKNNSLLGCALDSMEIQIYDMDTFRLVRRFSGHWNQITSLVFSPDGRWLASSATDATLRIWDLPSGRLIDWVQFDKSVISMDFSHKGEYLATTHAGTLGIFLWANQAYFSQVFLKPVSETPGSLDLPNLSAPTEEEGVEEESPETQEPRKTQEEIQTIKELNEKKWNQISRDLITMSNLPKSKWQTLPDLDIIKERNKPKEPPKKPEKAPFFLPTVSGPEGTFFLPAASKDDSIEPPSKIIRLSNMDIKTKFTQSLENASATNDFSECIEILKEMNPSAIEFELRSLSLQNDFLQIRLVMDMISQQLDTNQNFELLQAYLALFLKIHGDLIIENPLLAEQAKLLQEKEKESWGRLQGLFHNTLCLIKYFSGIQG